MAKRKLYIPEEVKEAIRKHIAEKYLQALQGYQSANEEEDTMTGHFGGILRIVNQKVIVNKGITELPGTWTWGIEYYKFRGRGPRATENFLGADGLFELKLKMGNREEKKSLLFQSKMDWIDDHNLLEQSVKLTTWREAAFILNYLPDKFGAIDLDDVILARGRRPEGLVFPAIDIYLCENFLNCIIGDLDLRYDAVRRLLVWRTKNDQIVATNFSIPQRISIRIASPSIGMDQNFEYNKKIETSEIHDYRMDATKEDMLSISPNFTMADIRKARKVKAKTYHSDLIVFTDNFLNEILKRRMQEMNAAVEILTKLRR